LKERGRSPRWHKSAGHDALLPTRFPLCVIPSPGPSDRIRRVGAPYCLKGRVSARLNIVGANRRLDAAVALHGRALDQVRGNPPIPRRPDIDKNVPLWPDHTGDDQSACRAGTRQSGFAVQPFAQRLKVGNASFLIQQRPGQSPAALFPVVSCPMQNAPILFPETELNFSVLPPVHLCALSHR
jgi:hypothetical protein